MSEYERADKAELIKRLKSLEAQVLDAKSSLEARRRLAETALRDSEERLRAILRTAVEGIITIDERGLVESMNPAAEKVFGYAANEVIGRNISMLMPAPYRENHDRYLDNFKSTGQARIIGIGREVVGLRKDGSVFPMDLAVSRVQLADKIIFTGFVRDITERKRLEKEILQISENEQRRIGQDLHDGICQHMAAVELMSQVLEQNLEKKSKSLAAQAGQIAKEMREVIAQTRSLARGLSPLVLESEGLVPSLQDLAAESERRFRIQCVVRCAGPVTLSDNLAAVHLYRIVQEAITNAVKHGKAGHIDISLAGDGEANIVLKVKDDGVGFAAKEDGERKGMGLLVMRYRAGVIGGSLEFQKEGRGTVLICRIGRPSSGSKS